MLMTRVAAYDIRGLFELLTDLELSRGSSGLITIEIENNGLNPEWSGGTYMADDPAIHHVFELCSDIRKPLVPSRD